jgi:hypothetical protein
MTPRNIVQTAPIVLFALLMPRSIASAQMPSVDPATGTGGPYYGTHYDSGVLSYGCYVPSPAMPLVHWQIAERICIENRLRRAEVYYELKQLHACYQAQRRRPRLTEEDVAACREDATAREAMAEIKLREATRRAQAARPEPLAEADYNRTTGRVAWPRIVLNDERFAEGRRQIDVLAARQVARSGQGEAAKHVDVRTTVSQMQITLLEMLRHGEVDGTTYSTAKRFLNRLVLSEAELARSVPAAELAAR